MDHPFLDLARHADQAAAALARSSIDAQQPAAFQLAWSQAELQAAQALLARPGLDELQQALGRAWAAEAATSVLHRLQEVALDLELPPPEARGVAAWCAGSGSSRTLAPLGTALLDRPEALDLPAAHDDIAMARDAFARFAREGVAPQAQAIHRQDLTVPESLLQPMRELGAFGLSIPQAYGGSATGGAHDNALMVAVTEVLSEASLGAAGSLITRPEILARALLAGGTEPQKQRWLPQIASGELLCGISITEPDHGSDVASLTLAATPVGGGWRLDGAKTWCTFAGKAQLLMVVARTDRDRALGHRGLSVLLVEKPSFDGHEFRCGSPLGGTLTGRAIPTLGYRGMHSYDLAFDGFVVPADQVIGGEAGLGRGFYFTMAGMSGGRLQTAGRACGVMRGAIHAALAHVRERRVFGARLADHPLTQVKLARMAARYLACRQLAEVTAQGGEGPAFAMQASLAKLLACRSAELVTREAQQLHGAMGYAEETPVARHFVDARVLSIFEGAEETLALKVIARALVDQAASGRKDDA